jgi:hypothetical protein
MGTMPRTTPSATRTVRASTPMARQVVWLLAAAGVGYTSSALFSGVLRLPRPWFIATHALVTSVFLVGYLWSNRIGVHQLLRRHTWRGLAGAVILGAFMAWSMQRQPASVAPQGSGLVLALAWLGLVYGIVDALLLNVLPVVATWRAFEAQGWTGGIRGRVATATTGLLSSLTITAAYHLGFAEFQGPELTAPLFGNGLITIGYLLAGNPITAVVAHLVLHVASVLHGIDTTMTLPPHY